MVCDKCQRKLDQERLVTPDVWKKGAGPADSSRGRAVGQNMMLNKKFMAGVRKCGICKQKVSRDVHYCTTCAHQKGICAMCGVRVMDLSFYRGGGDAGDRKRKSADGGDDDDGAGEASAGEAGGAGGGGQPKAAKKSRSDAGSGGSITTAAGGAAGSSSSSSSSSSSHGSGGGGGGGYEGGALFDRIATAMARRAGTGAGRTHIGSETDPHRAKWVAVKDANGRVYYFNRGTQQTKWALGPGETCEDQGASAIIVGAKNPERRNENTAVDTRQGKHHPASTATAATAASGGGAGAAAASTGGVAGASAGAAWVEMKDPLSKRTYYFNKTTKKTLWTRPAELGGGATTTSSQAPPPSGRSAAAAAAAAAAATSSSDGAASKKGDISAGGGGSWKAVPDQASGKTYWYHTVTRQTTWQDPHAS